MKTKHLYYIIALMAFALFGLLILQYNWIKQSMQVQNEQFNFAVQKALSQSFKKLNQYDQADRKRAHFSLDLIEEVIEPVEKTASFHPEKSELERIFENLHDFRICSEIHLRTLYHPDGSQSLAIIQNDNQLSLQSVMERATDHLNFSMQEYYSPKKIQKALTSSLKESGIDTDWQFCLRTPNQILAHSNNSAPKDTWQKTPYKRSHYQNEFTPPVELLLHFPKKKAYLRSNSFAMLSSSLLFNSIIMLVFVYTIHVIFRQKQLSEMKTDFINNMTHELKTPISTIRLASEMLTDSSIQHNSSSMKRYVGMIRDENNRLQDHVEKVLTYARLEKGNVKFNKEPISLHHLLEEVIQNASLKVNKLNGSMDVFLNAQENQVYGDSLHLKNVFSNLLDNAIKYRKEIPKIKIRSKNVGNEIIVSVTDEGIGMNKEALQRIFEKFYRVPTGNVHNVKGFGLGLSYVKQVVDAHEGQIKAESKLHVGTTIHCHLPIIKIES